MPDPGNPENERIDYNREYVERFAKAKAEAEAKGLKYEHPSRDGIGWKIHLAVSDTFPPNPLTQRIAEFIQAHRLSFKVGKGGTEEGGKGMTIYVGDRDTTEDLAQELTDYFGDEIPEPRGDVLVDDMQVVGRVWGRFENELDASRNPRLREFGDQKYSYYGSDGVPWLSKDYRHWSDPNQFTQQQRRERGVNALTEDYGAFFTGTRNHPV